MSCAGWLMPCRVAPMSLPRTSMARFQRAGFPDERAWSKCTVASVPAVPADVPAVYFSRPAPGNPDGDAVAVDPETCRAAEPLPHCPGVARWLPKHPHVQRWRVLTDRYLTHSSDRMRGWLSKLPAGKLVVVELGRG